ncbi:MAG: hypothetical protein KDC53_02925 [Saprospiraceae bacterium]|nr:hypothetical protein [Saprospiraceae bacterium]
MVKYFLGLQLVLTLSGCIFTESDPIDELSSQKYPGVDSSLYAAFSMFEYEGNLRGFSIDLSNSGITASFTDIPEIHVAGQCRYDYLNRKSILIDSIYWHIASGLNRELIVFHELGHCYLDRDHLDTAFSNGICRSIMRSGTCCCQDAYNERNRKYYLDELFGINVKN